MGEDVVFALRGVNLQLAGGELIAIVGSSGSGKSTLMNILGCLDRPSHGRYVLGGLDVSEMSAEERALVRNRLIGFIFQGFHLLPRTSALDNVELPLIYRGLKKAERRRLALEALARVGLAERVDHLPSELSGGQQQRVAIARALVTTPPLLLADEPTGNLDSVTTWEVLSLLQDVVQEQERTVLLVTHEPDVAQCADRIVTVGDGRILSNLRNQSPSNARQLLPAAQERRGADAH
ncbi:MAG: ABC transporter ATP-binding protein [Polyangiaceae bacterium]|nr:ABC transporter ATP-binding protein [Polyangiaceae bacterium]